MGNQTSSNSDDEEASSSGKDSLSTAEIRLVKQLWVEARRKGPDEPGRSILSSVFIRSPDIYNVMEGTANAQRKSSAFASPNAGSSRTQSFDIHRHSRNFTQGLDTVVHNLNDSAFVQDYLVSLGERHARIPMGRLLPPRFWDTFGGCMIEKTFEWGSWKQRGAICQKAWGKVVQLIVLNMKTGYYAETKRQNKISASSSNDNFMQESVSAACLGVPSQSHSIIKSASDVRLAKPPTRKITKP